MFYMFYLCKFKFLRYSLHFLCASTPTCPFSIATLTDTHIWKEREILNFNRVHVSSDPLVLSPSPTHSTLTFHDRLFIFAVQVLQYLPFHLHTRPTHVSSGPMSYEFSFMHIGDFWPQNGWHLQNDHFLSTVSLWIFKIEQ